MYNENDKQSVEKYSSAVSLSDMEVFIFPELMYALFLANVMSPRLWEWRKDSWFEGLEKMNLQRRVQRLKQYIMDHFGFNLDLDTWGLTTKEKELSRFSDYINESVLGESNALFGYEGDKYYFDIDIRRHFGLDKYTSSTIPYWKTETLEAMEAFKYKEGYSQGAGECVSLAGLYASSAFAVIGIPIDDIYMMATPLHSQNFLTISTGIITNNRRIVTKNMWYNGTELSDKARRAIENEKITIVAHHSGYIHTLYEEATIDKAHYSRFKEKFLTYLKTDITYEILANFLRQNSKLQKCFQIEHNCCGKSRYIQAEKVYSYEHNSKSRIGDPTQNVLLHEIEEDEFYPAPIPNRMMLGEIEAFFKSNKVPVDEKTTIEKLKQYLQHSCFTVDEVMHDLISFCKITPRLPDTNKKWSPVSTPINLDGINSAEEALERLEKMRDNPVVDLAFTAYRDLTRSPWKPFLKAAFERCPASIAQSKDLDDETVYNKLCSMGDESIYPGPYRLAQPDEVWNFNRGDGLEKGITLMNILKSRYPQEVIQLIKGKGQCIIKHGEKEYRFNSRKDVPYPVEKDFVY